MAGQDPLQNMSIERWPDLQKVFLSDWPRSLPGYNVLETQIRWKQAGLNYGFQVFCPFGDVQNGFVGINEKDSSYDIVIQYPKNDTQTLKDALLTTKLINWASKKPMKLSFAAGHVVECMMEVLKDKNLKLDLDENCHLDTFYLDKHSPLFENVDLPPGCTFEILTSEHVSFIDSFWPHRYATSSYYFQLLIDSKSGYGLFKDGKLISWMLIGECGNLTHLYTLEEHRKKGYAELLVKLISNATLMERKSDTFAFCVKKNLVAHKLYEKIGLTVSNEVFWLDIVKIPE